MDTFVAVKPFLDFQISFISRYINASGKSDTERHKFGLSVLYELQSMFMQEALFFDKVHLIWPDAPNEFLDLIKSLTEGGETVFSFVDIESILPAWESMPSLPREDMETLWPLLNWGTHNLKEQDSRAEKEYPLYDFVTRVEAWRIEHVDKVSATPLLSYTSYQPKLPTSARYDIAQLIIHNMPVPDSRRTRWEQIIEYRQNPDNRQDLLGLRRWIRRLSTEDRLPAECAEELEWQMNEFQKHMRLHRIKANMGTLEVMVKTPLEILENLVTLKFSKLVDPLFAIKKRQISLMEAELNAPGREIAYLIKTKQAFE